MLFETGETRASQFVPVGQLIGSQKRQCLFEIGFAMAAGPMRPRWSIVLAAIVVIVLVVRALT